MEVEKTISTSSKVNFVGWKNPLKGWGSWVEKLRSSHESTWIDAGIFEAIMNSTILIKRDDNLIFEMASRWSSETNTFVYPWGEATLTLEDMLILGGFSPSGISPLISVKNDPKWVEISERLEHERLELRRSKAHNVYHNQWMARLKDCENSELEHVAFLSLWLSRFVFVHPVASPTGIINKLVFPIAYQLSRGIKIALGPSVLAMLYRDLTVLARRIHSREITVELNNLSAIFVLVQIWSWERFTKLSPFRTSKSCLKKTPRFTRWSIVKSREVKDYKSTIDSSENYFIWCPYGDFVTGGVRDPEPLGRCITINELVGFGSCTEKYQPKRVMRQFGLSMGTRVEFIDLVDSDSDDERTITIYDLEDSIGEVGASSEVESSVNGRSKYTDPELDEFDMRLTRLENVVTANIKELEDSDKTP